MKKLRLLKFYNPYHKEAQKYSLPNAVIKIRQPKCLLWLRCSRTINFLPDELRYLCWYGYPSKALPLSFCPKNLVQLHLIRSHVEQLCRKNQCFENLKLMDLSYSVKLIRIPDLSRFPKLEILNLKGCTSLVEIRSTRLYYSELRHLNLQSCRSLCYFSSFLHMEHLDFLSLEDCPKIIEFPVIPRSIKFLTLSKTAVKKVPSSIEHCSQLTKLEMESCTSLQSLPSNIGELQVLELLNLKGCSKLTSLPDSTSSLKSLKSLFINECINLKELPESIGNLKSLEKLEATRSGIRILPPTINGLVKLEQLDCNGCRDLVLPPFTGLPSLKRLSLDDCGLSEISDSLGSLKSLLVLCLDGNNLKKLPMTIKQLSKLTILHLRSNKRLEYIPELPSTLHGLSVHNCTSLETISSLTYANTDNFQFLDARNCINLDQSCGTKIMDAVLLGIENKLPRMRHFRKYDQRLCNEELLRRVRLAGDKLPERMKHTNEKGSTIFISMEQYHPLDSMVVVFSTVVAPTDNKTKTATKFDKSAAIKCECCFVTESGCCLKECFYHDLFRPNKYSDEYALSLENNWVWAYKFKLKDKRRFTEASFRFFVKTRRFAETENGDLRVIKCGVLCLPY
ncbi:Disease resistance protein (TIR-NBS-LRR class) family [Euphorbia peplus]|nr:Disease resistance protein (TIR-NBS-LRR class) family [Euphorbia peplus]